MGLEVAALVVSAAGTAYTGMAQADAASESASAQRRSRAEQQAKNAADAAKERRQQIREERVKQARIQQASINTGTSGSSGETGALSSITTQTQANEGFNLGAIQRGNNISLFSQQAADADLQFQQMGILNQNIQGLTKVGVNIFKA